MFPSDKDPVYGTFVKVFYDNIRLLNNSGDTSLIAIKGRNGSKLFKYICFYIKILYKLLFYEYDIVYVHTVTFPIPPIWLANKLKKIPLVFNIHGADLLGNGKLVQLLRNMGYEIVVNSKLIVSPSNYYLNKIKKYYSLDNSRIFVSPSGGIDTNIFRPMHLQRDPSVFMIGLVTRIDENKGWDTFIKAIRLLRDDGYNIKGIIAGRGTQVRAMYELISDLDVLDVIDYIGPIPRENLPMIYSQFDLFCNCSRRKEESLGLVTIEAMACGIPVIGSNMAGTAECINNEIDGLLFDPYSAEDLYYKIVKYIKFGIDTKKLYKQNAIIRAKQFETSKIMNLLYTKLKSIVLN